MLHSRLPGRQLRCLAPTAPCMRSRRLRASVATAALNSNDIKNGLTLLIDGTPWKVVEFLHVKPGKGAAFVRSKLKSLKTGNTVEKTFRSGEGIELADVQKKSCQFTYTEGPTYVFMDMESYEEIRVPRDDDWAAFLKEGTDCDVVFFNGNVISIEPPKTMVLVVKQCDPGIKGNSAGSGTTKPATLETGGILQVPLFVETGDEVKVDTRENKYLGRAE